MSHNIARENNGEYAVFTAGALPWHRLGQNVEECQTWSEAMRLAHLDWEVECQPLYDRRGNVVEAWGTFRKDNGRFLASVGSRYTPIQNGRMFEFVDLLIGTRAAHYESAGALDGGRKVWCLARIPGATTEIVPGDEHQAYILFCSSHDGSLAATCQPTSVRVVCSNTLTTALNERGVSRISVRHTASGEARLARAQKMLEASLRAIQDVRQKLRILAERNLTRESFEEALNRLFPPPKGKDEELRGRRRSTLEAILRLYERNDGSNGIASISGTAYNLYNAVTEYVDHYRPVRTSQITASLSDAQKRAQSALFGSGAQLKERALEVLLETTSGAPKRTYVSEYKPVELGGILDDIVDATAQRRQSGIGY